MVVDPTGNIFYVYVTGVNSGTIYEGSYANGDWHYIPIYSNASAGALSASATFVKTFDVAHVDRDLNLRLSSWSLFGGWRTQLVDGEGESTFNNLGGEISTVAFGGKLYIFYHEWNQPWVGKNVLRCAVYDGSAFTYQTLDGNGGTGGRVRANLTDPAAVAAPDGLRVYYYDQDHAVLREYSKDGINWTSFANLDGTGAYGGIVGDVGRHPSAIVYNGSVNVFYEDRTNARLRTAHLSGKWTFGSIDTIDAGSSNAPVVHNNAMHVYYTTSGQLRGAWGIGPGTFNVLPIDGAGGVVLGRSTDWMFTPVTALEFNNAPSVF